MRSKNRLKIEQLDRRLKPFSLAKKSIVPKGGWIKNIRISLNMTLEQLGSKLKITKQGMKSLEKREGTGKISIKSLKEVASALDMELVYGFAPKRSTVEELIEQRAMELARKIVLRTHHNMKLESQHNDEKRIKLAIKELATKYKDEIPKMIWI